MVLDSWIHVLSPHFDDACFSLGIAISSSAASGRRVRIVNCFTRSAYAPRSAYLSTADEVTFCRAVEDRTFVESLRKVESIDLGFVDAPLRRPCFASSPFTARPFDADDRADVERLALAIGKICGCGELIVPLGLGDHIDHRIVKAAALTLQHPAVAFYEDLPYAAAATDAEILAAATAAGREISRELVPIIVRLPNGSDLKRRLAGMYASQVTPAQVDDLAAVARRHRNGERIWADATTAATLVLPRPALRSCRT